MDRPQAFPSSRFVERSPKLIRIRPGLGLKLLLIAVVVSLTGVLASSLLVESLQHQQLIDLAKRTSSQAGDLIAVSLEHSMLDNGQMSNQIIQAMVGEGIVRHIQVLDTQGVIRASSNPAEVGRLLDRNAPLCQDCHAQDPTPSSKTVIAGSGAGSSALLTVSPIHNQPECVGCHDARTQVLGVSMVEAPLAELNDEVTASRDRIIQVGLATFILMVGLLVVASRFFVTRPISELTKGILEVGRGDLDHPVRPQAHDELGDLTESFNWMRQQLQLSRAEAAQRNRELGVLYQVGTQVSASQRVLYRVGAQGSDSPELSAVLDAVAEGARQLLPADIGFVGIVDQAQSRISIKSCSGARTALLKEMSIPLSAIESQPVLNVENLGSNSPITRAADLAAREGIVSLLGVPLRRSERVLGMVGVLSRTRRHLSPSDVQLLSRLAAQVEVAIENARLYEQVRYLAVLEERDRLAREMHDDFSQALGYMSLKTALTTEQLARGQIPDVQSSLQELTQVIQEAYTDVREAIFSLRTTVPFRAGLSAIVHEYMAEYQAHFGIRTQLIADNETSTEFSQDATVQVVRIIQEAMTNIRKHAAAKNVTVRFDREDGHIRISIQDDGCGFDPAVIAKKDDHAFGLDIMRERAKTIGGTLELDSQPGRGTRIVVCVPWSDKV